MEPLEEFVGELAAVGGKSIRGKLLENLSFGRAAKHVGVVKGIPGNEEQQELRFLLCEIAIPLRRFTKKGFRPLRI